MNRFIRSMNSFNYSDGYLDITIYYYPVNEDGTIETKDDKRIGYLDFRIDASNFENPYQPLSTFSKTLKELEKKHLKGIVLNARQIKHLPTSQNNTIFTLK